MLKLIKDFRNYQFVYFWINNKRKVVSPLLPTLEHARDWYTEQHFSDYEGEERRVRRIDRRYDVKSASKKSNNESSRRLPSSPGRRKSDRTIEVDFDLSVEKISKLKEAQ